MDQEVVCKRVQRVELQCDARQLLGSCSIRLQLPMLIIRRPGDRQVARLSCYRICVCVLCTCSLATWRRQCCLGCTGVECKQRVLQRHSTDAPVLCCVSLQCCMVIERVIQVSQSFRRDIYNSNMQQDISKILTCKKTFKQCKTYCAVCTQVS